MYNARQDSKPTCCSTRLRVGHSALGHNGAYSARAHGLSLLPQEAHEVGQHLRSLKGSLAAHVQRGLVGGAAGTCKLTRC